MPPKDSTRGRRPTRPNPSQVLAARARLNAAANMTTSTSPSLDVASTVSETNAPAVTPAPTSTPAASSSLATSLTPTPSSTLTLTVSDERTAETLVVSQENTQHTESSDSQLESQETSLSQIPDSQLSVNHKKTTCRWTEEDDAALIHALVAEKTIHPSTVNGFKAVSWHQAMKALEGSEIENGSKAKDIAACKSRWFALKKMYTSFKTLWTMSGAGWDESAKMISLPPAVWKDLSLNTSSQGRELSRWQNRPFPLFHDLNGLIEGNIATGDLMMTTADDEPVASGDIGNDIPPDSQLEDDSNDDTPEITPTASLATPSSSKQKRGSAVSPDVILTEMRNMTSSWAESMRAPIPPLIFSPSAPPPTIHMQAISLVQQEDGLLPSQIFEAIDFLARDSNSEVYVSLNEALRPTWLRMKLGW
ncbi:hypothetical protein PCANC_28400 [Puccinia coronata f. sp. avenae]|uniref:Myb/SANT-like domain-containing protein n=1 Tax=Puccinia coronata f. sp. avenae TaxID=200324 RepID=A0A2N5RW00_9BASI|nr:hypothetical protein PCANC_28400 [Puccinia coronata f. sp. avenae]